MYKIEQDGTTHIELSATEDSPMLPATLVGCSSKSYFTAAQARAWGPRVLDGVAEAPQGATGLFCCPSFPLIPTLLETLGAGGGLVGAQDVSPYPPGPFTGETTPRWSCPTQPRHGPPLLRADEEGVPRPAELLHPGERRPGPRRGQGAGVVPLAGDRAAAALLGARQPRDARGRLPPARDGAGAGPAPADDQPARLRGARRDVRVRLHLRGQPRRGRRRGARASARRWRGCSRCPGRG